MDLKKNKINNFKIKPPSGKTSGEIPTPHDICKLSTVMIFNAKRQGGKSVAVTNYLKKLLDLGLMDRIIILTPTWLSNKDTYTPLNIEEEDVLEPGKGSIKEVIQIVEGEKADWDLFCKQKQMYERFKNDMQGNIAIKDIPPNVLLQYHEWDFFNRRPEWKYKKEVSPRLFLIIDDMLGTPLMLPSSGLINLIIKHRHIGDGCGISVAMLVQSYACQGGLNRAIRENCCQLALFKNTDLNQRKKIIQEMGDVDEEKFLKMFDYATQEPFGFLFIDFNAKSKEQQFRKNFDEYLNF